MNEASSGGHRLWLSFSARRLLLPLFSCRRASCAPSLFGVAGIGVGSQRPFYGKSCKGKREKGGRFAFSLSLCLSVCAVLFSFALPGTAPWQTCPAGKAVVSGRIAVLGTTEIRSALELTVEEISAPVSPTFLPLSGCGCTAKQQDFQPGDRLTCQIQFYDNDKASLLRLQNQGIDQRQRQTAPLRPIPGRAGILFTRLRP